MKRFQFVATTIIEADSEEEAKAKFADSSFDFAAQAECYDVTNPASGPNYEDYVALVRKMRDAQRLYFRQRSSYNLQNAKQLEKQVDEFFNTLF